MTKLGGNVLVQFNNK